MLIQIAAPPNLVYLFDVLRCPDLVRRQDILRPLTEESLFLFPRSVFAVLVLCFVCCSSSLFLSQ